jgi:ATP-binding cassette, subfamily F, member 3
LRVTTIEATIADLTSQLDDTTLYDSPAGVQKATMLGRKLDEEREALDDAMHDWSVAEEAVLRLKS